MHKGNAPAVMGILQQMSPMDLDLHPCPERTSRLPSPTILLTTTTECSTHCTAPADRGMYVHAIPHPQTIGTHELLGTAGQCRFLAARCNHAECQGVSNKMQLRSPDIQLLTSKCKQGSSILISAPFYTEEGLNWVQPNPGGCVEFWTRFNPRDWAAGVSDPPALLRFLEKVGEERVSLRVHRALHAKIYQVDKTWSWIGSPNLTQAAFTSNIELVVELNGEENQYLGHIVNDLRSSLRELPIATLQAYIDACKDVIRQLEDKDVWKNEDFQAAVELADEYLSPEPTLNPTPSIAPLDDFISFIDAMTGDVPQLIQDHYHNLSGQNRQGHVKQSYYALIHFLSNPTMEQHINDLMAMSLDHYPQLPSSFVEAWISFLDENAQIQNEDLGYSFSILRNVLPEHVGGFVTNGGGGIGTFTRMALLVAHFLRK